MVVTQPPTLLHGFQLFPSASLSALPLSFLPLTESSLSRSSHSLAARSGSSLLQRTHLLSLSATSSSCCEVSSMASTPPLHNQMRCLWQIRG
ncbi:hypothetical protein JHK82_019777 [Glycine max]|uniref:Uncharacterized protein n=1 Tax=Glycine soja TaxID=3848 RepID=A0A445K1N3_GLYSO|nr:hypothetical protein JHK85_020223 [Glycine max]KAG5038955.1 hypothetical protein JHK86_019795 [Glycine max]KAG5144082.1 hypothetical protein JHK82_019777 [Glycine max]KHN02983.1 hypothetical protein glysoja_009849 [Glycine soja]RZC04538.1 hypothetical protein D0Y65_018918 [Glycine soja]